MSLSPSVYRLSILHINISAHKLPASTEVSILELHEMHEIHEMHEMPSGDLDR